MDSQKKTFDKLYNDYSDKVYFLARFRGLGEEIRLIIWIIALPFFIAYYIIKKMISQRIFKSKLKRSGIPNHWANKLTHQYSPSLREILELTKAKKGNIIKHSTI